MSRLKDKITGLLPRSYVRRKILSAVLVCLAVSWAMPDHSSVLRFVGVNMFVYWGIVLLP